MTQSIEAKRLFNAMHAAEPDEVGQLYDRR